MGWPGSVHDTSMFVIFKRITDDNILAGMDRTLCGSRVPVCIVGDSAYPLQTWLMKPFIDSPSLSVQQVFQLSPLMSSHCCGKRIWTLKGTIEAAAQEE